MQLNNVFENWLLKSNITKEVQETFQIKAGTHLNIGECITIPVFDLNGDFLFNKYRRSPLDDRKPKYLYDQGGHVSLYGAHKAKDEKRIFLVEGEKDALVMWSKNLPAVSSTGGALSFKAEWADFFKDKEVIICYDNDEAGGLGMARIIKHIPHAKILFLPDRAGVKDIADYVASGGDIHTLINTAQHLADMVSVEQDRAQRVSLWKSTFYHDAFIKEYSQPVRVERRVITLGEPLERAKKYPIENILDFTANKAICPFHNEKTPSLQYYAKTNTCYCFGACGRMYDSIAIYMKVNNCTFKEALKAMQ